VPSCHATTIVEAKDGTLVAAWFAGEAEGKPDVSIWVARQVDGKWSAPVMVAEGVQADGKRFPCWNPVFFQPKEGPLQLYYKVGPNPVKWWGMLRLSEDNGKTWGEARRLPDGILGPIKNKPVQLKDGTILSGCSAEGLKVGPSWQIHFERSRDNGVTWERIAVEQGQGAPESIQPSILFLKDGSLMSLGRTRNGKVFSTVSGDQGSTWSKVELIDLPNPNSGTDAVTLKDGRHLLIYNHTAKGRSPLNLAVSKDGITWEAAMVLEDEPKAEFSYPAIIQSADGLVHITYTWKRKLAKHVVIDPAKIVARPMEGMAWPKAAEAQGGQAGLERLKYNNPGLVVDLGVGLWAWPLPMDVDGDGKFSHTYPERFWPRYVNVNKPDDEGGGVSGRKGAISGGIDGRRHHRIIGHGHAGAAGGADGERAHGGRGHQGAFHGLPPRAVRPRRSAGTGRERGCKVKRDCSAQDAAVEAVIADRAHGGLDARGAAADIRAGRGGAVTTR
jgi:predicted neuraminidase